MRHFLSITHEQRLPQNLGQCSRSLTNLLLLHMSDTLVRDRWRPHADYPLRAAFAGTIQQLYIS